MYNGVFASEMGNNAVRRRLAHNCDIHYIIFYNHNMG